VWRGGRIESRHRISLAVVDPEGSPIMRIGDVDTPVFPRSAAKPLQALPLVESGAADTFGVSQEELALACASHGGEPMHVERVAAWLARLGRVPDELACGPHPPSHKPSADRLVRAGQSPSRLHNNCSGKHTGMLTLTLHLNAPTDGYEAPDHPVQRTIAATIGELCDLPGLERPGIDGCSLPNWPIPLRNLALAMARLGHPEALPPPRREAARRITAAMRGHPELVAGTGRCCTAVMQALPTLVVKTGAEGVFVAIIPHRRLGVALKAEDGAGRAAEVALLAVLQALGEIDAAAARRLGEFARPAIRNHAGLEVGRIAPAEGWPAGTTS
jgi:L-asparaginase II